MQYQDLPLFILFVAAIYLTVIYVILKLAERHRQEDSSSSLTSDFSRRIYPTSFQSHD